MLDFGVRVKGYSDGSSSVVFDFAEERDAVSLAEDLEAMAADYCGPDGRALASLMGVCLRTVPSEGGGFHAMMGPHNAACLTGLLLRIAYGAREEAMGLRRDLGDALLEAGALRKRIDELDPEGAAMRAATMDAWAQELECGPEPELDDYGNLVGGAPCGDDPPMPDDPGGPAEAPDSGPFGEE